MNSKLTLTIEQDVIEKAKKYAKSKGRSLSDIVENYFKVIVKDEERIEISRTPITDSLKGSFKTPENMDYKRELTISLQKKYL